MSACKKVLCSLMVRCACARPASQASNSALLCRSRASSSRYSDSLLSGSLIGLSAARVEPAPAPLLAGYRLINCQNLSQLRWSDHALTLLSPNREAIQQTQLLQIILIRSRRLFLRCRAIVFVFQRIGHVHGGQRAEGLMRRLLGPMMQGNRFNGFTPPAWVAGSPAKRPQPAGPAPRELCSQGSSS